MGDLLEPSDEKQLVDCLAWGCANQQPVELCGTGSKRAYGRPVQAAAMLKVARLSGIVTYEPAELVLTARAATPIAEIEAALDAAGQQLAFEPADLGPLLGGPAGAGS
ncbi:MAG: FAD-binding protein, partial [Alphaproteobacteria bacterium]|nr:FAD-binding protein [Alphaproteobacteria bacterium]